MWDWNVAVVCRNEEASIGHCINSIADASQGRRVFVTLIVNGSSDASANVALEAARRRGSAIAIYTIQHADKANALNHFFYALREPADYYFFVDAYVRIGPKALAALETCLATRPEVTAATGVAANGRTMPQNTSITLERGGHLHGQLHALRRDFVDRLVARNIRLPIGLYYGDGLMGSMAMHNLDPIGIPWVTQRIGGSPDATYEIPELSMFRIQDIKRQYHRKIRQMRGRLENAAIRSLVYESGYEGLPEYADDMIKTFVAQHGVPRATAFDRPFQALAMRQVNRSDKPEPSRLQPILMRRLEGAQAAPA
jgi:glycosyltransferase involved in cell wall biosynthesis